MSAVDLVQRCWVDVATRKGCAGPAAVAVLDEILRAYREPHRHYHTLDHIAALLELQDRHTGAGNDRDAIALAILLHDLVYDPRRQDNEEVSASLAGGHLTGLGLPKALIVKVMHCILATRHGQGNPVDDDADIALLLDLDLSILAAPRDAYRAYALAVRREYAHVPDVLYRPGRRRVLEGFLTRKHIFLTARLRPLWEAPARDNLAAEIADLI
jgi:predicted metal-dependent HD superfamily phosphohydrolase